MDDVIAITQVELKAAMLQWETDSRLGGWSRGDDLPVEKKADESAEYLWGLLKQK